MRSYTNRHTNIRGQRQFYSDPDYYYFIAVLLASGVYQIGDV